MYAYVYAYTHTYTIHGQVKRAWNLWNVITKADLRYMMCMSEHGWTEDLYPQ